MMAKDVCPGKMCARHRVGKRVVTVTAAPASPALLAPPVFSVGGVQYAFALHQDGAFFGRDGLIADGNFRPAQAGDVITLYGVGFGATTPAVPAGLVVASAAPLANPRVLFGDRPGEVLFGGLAPGAVGLYQFNVIVPPGISGDVSLSVTAGGATSRQSLRLTIAE